MSDDLQNLINMRQYLTDKRREQANIFNRTYSKSSQIEKLTKIQKTIDVLDRAIEDESNLQSTGLKQHT